MPPLAALSRRTMPKGSHKGPTMQWHLWTDPGPQVYSELTNVKKKRVANPSLIGRMEGFLSSL